MELVLVVWLAFAVVHQTLLLVYFSGRIKRLEIRTMISPAEQAIIDGLNADAVALKQSLADKDAALATKDATIADLTSKLAAAEAAAEDPAFIAGLTAAKGSLDALVPAPAPVTPPADPAAPVSPAPADPSAQAAV